MIKCRKRRERKESKVGIHEYHQTFQQFGDIQNAISRSIAQVINQAEIRNLG